MKRTAVSKPVMERLPLYLQYLKAEQAIPGKTVSSTTIARALNLGDVQVRKDLGLISGAGKPKVGYVACDLIRQLEQYLRSEAENTAVVVGAGKLGQALMGYGGFREYGLTLAAAFDSDPQKTGSGAPDAPLPMTEFPAYCARVRPRIGIITVPEDQAEKVCRLMVENGIRAIWNFSRRRLRVPDGILVRNEDLASSLAALSGALNEI